MYSLTSANRYYLYQGFVRMNLGIDGLFKITITFNSGTTISVKRATPGGVIKMLRDYERKEGDPCIL